MDGYQRLGHFLDAVWDKDSEVLILGTFPSAKSRENKFFYGHPQNRFWKVLAAVTGSVAPVTIEDKRKLLLDNNIALWDVIARCSIKGSSDSSIKDVVPNDINPVIKGSRIGNIYANGIKAYELYMKYSYPETGREIIKLPSTSPANAMYSLERLIDAWKVIIPSHENSNNI